jgi:Ca2+-binding RTX toxin-like protein
MTIDLDAGSVTSSDGSEDTIENFENASSGSGDDKIVANDEANVLKGGAGRDIFMFLSPNGSGKGSRDSIMDFEVGDKIDLTSFDSNGQKNGLEKLTFDFSGTGYNGISQAWVTYEEKDGSKANTLLQFKFKDIDVSENKVDYEIQIYGVYDLDDDNVLY